MVKGLFTDEVPPRLIGGREGATGRLVFPCPDNPHYEPHPLKRTGTLWSYTIQRYRPKSPPYAGPQDFAPFVVAYVALPDELIVEARLVNVAFEAIKIGMAVELTQTVLDPADPDSSRIPAFQPVEQCA
ncbi:MAG: OB-fold domain-containing protein [Alphaproteobacteria bacterium]|nr:OB-fold domain-containing protein [Alphaproteobacteria bacterium]